MFGLDALLLVAFLLAKAPHLTGLPAHEWVGIGFGFAVLPHLLLSWSWIASATRGLWAPGPLRRRVNYALNATLFTLTVTVIVTGLVISQVVLPDAGVTTVDDEAWRRLHNSASTWILILVGLHIALNWRWIVAAVRRHALLPATPHE